MKKAFVPLILTAGILFSLCCGKKGPIYPPLVNIPKAIEDYRAFQRGDRIILNWNNPTAYIDGRPVEEITRVDIWLFVEDHDAIESEESGKVEKEDENEEKTEEEKQVEDRKDKNNEGALSRSDEFFKNAKLIASILKENFPDYRNPIQEKELTGNFICAHKLSSEDLSNKTFTFGLKARIEKKESDFSALLSIKPRPLPFPPSGLKATVFEDKIEIGWIPPEKNCDDSSPADVMGYNVYRKSEKEGMRRLSMDLIKDTEYSDSDFQFEVLYLYYVRASVNESSPFLESDDSRPLELVPHDTFPPEMPRGLVAISGDDFVSLSWEANKEQDLAGYRVWRKGGEDKNYRILTELIRENVFNDSAVEKEKRYDYVITALDKSGNESPKSKSISVFSERGSS